MSETKKLAAYVMTIISVILGSLALPAVQILGGSVPRFELTALLFGTQAVASIPVLLYQRLPLWIPRQHLPYLLCEILVLTMENVCLYSAPRYLPVGSTDALGAALVILVCTAVSVFQRTASKAMVVSVLVCVMGILLVAHLYLNMPIYTKHRGQIGQRNAIPLRLQT